MRFTPLTQMFEKTAIVNISMPPSQYVMTSFIPEVVLSAIQITDPLNGNLVRQEIQAAIDSTPVSGIVVLPPLSMNIEGVINCPDGITIQGQGRDLTSLRRRDEPGGGSFANPIFRVECTRQLPFKFFGIELHGIGRYLLTSDPLDGGNATGTVRDHGLLILGKCEDVEIYNSRFTKFTRAGIEFVGTGLSSPAPDGRQTGVIYQNQFFDIYWTGLGYGIAIVGDATYPISTPALGTADALFIEDNEFGAAPSTFACRHNVTSVNGSRYVFRNNTLRNSYHDAGAIDTHGFESWPAGSRTFEIYNNNSQNPNPTAGGNFQGVGIRGGEGVIWNNVLDDVSQAINLRCRNCPTDGDHDSNVWIWDNTKNGGAANIIEDDPFGTITANEFALPGWTPFTYPHPLRS